MLKKKKQQQKTTKTDQPDNFGISLVSKLFCCYRLWGFFFLGGGRGGGGCFGFFVGFFWGGCFCCCCCCLVAVVFFYSLTASSKLGRSRFHGLNLACILMKSRIASDFLESRTGM